MYLIAAVDKNWGIGMDNALQVYIPEDLKRFRALTLGHPVVLGRSTLATFPGGKPLPKRPNFILSRQKDLVVEGAEVVHSVDEALAVLPPDTFVIGGASVYEQFLDHCHTAYITKIADEMPADRWFPNLDDHPQWQVTERSETFHHEGLDFCYVTYQRTVTETV